MNATRRSFTLTELLVVIALIALLTGLLLAGLGKAQTASKRLQSIATMQAFINACNTFKAEHGYYPGVVPEHVLAFHNHEVAHDNGRTAMSATENAVLALMGGYFRYDDDPSGYAERLATGDWVEHAVQRPPTSGDPQPPDFLFIVDPDRIGEGPIIGGKSYAPYLAPDDSELRTTDTVFGQWGGTGEEPERTRLPELVDAWGSPLLYIRRARGAGPLVGSGHPHQDVRFWGLLPQFYVDANWPYLRAGKQMWVDPRGEGDGSGSILSTGYDGNPGLGLHDVEQGFAFIIRTETTGGHANGDLTKMAAQGDLMVISAGADRIYFSGIDGPGSTTAPIGSAEYRYRDFVREDQSVLETFDDIRISG